MLQLTPQEYKIVRDSIFRDLERLIAKDGRVPKEDVRPLATIGMRHIPMHRSLQSYAKALIEDYILEARGAY